MPIDWVKLSEAIPYAGVAIIFGLFMVTILKQNSDARQRVQDKQDAKDERRDKLYLDAAALRNSEFISSIERRDANWRDFMALQQTQRTESWSVVSVKLGDLASLIVSLSTLVRDTNVLIAQHDNWERRELAIRMPVKPATGPLTPQRRGTDIYYKEAPDAPAPTENDQQ